MRRDLREILYAVKQFVAFGRRHGWGRNLYRLGAGLLYRLSNGRCQVATAELMAATVAQLRCIARLPRTLQVRLARPEDAPRLSRFLPYAERTAERFAAGDQCVLALDEDRVLATEWFKLGPAASREDLEELGVLFRVPPAACWLYGGVSGRDGRALGPWGAAMGRLRGFLEERQVDRVYLQVGYENPYSIACHASLGFHVIGRVCCLRVRRKRFVLYKTPRERWVRLRGGSLDLRQLERVPGSAAARAPVHHHGEGNGYIHEP